MWDRLRFTANYIILLAGLFLFCSVVMGKSAELFPLYRTITIFFIVLGASTYIASEG